MQYVLVAILILLVFTTNVHAGCSWVFWVKHTIRYYDASARVIDWNAKSGFSRLDECKSSVEKYIERSTKNAKEGNPEEVVNISRSDVGGEQQVMVTIQGENTQTIISIYKCLPDTIKP